MKNLIKANLEILEKTNYVRKAKPEANYWCDFSASVMNKFRKATKDNFNLIVYGDENIHNDYYIIPFKLVKEKFTEKNYSGNRERWVFNIIDHKLKVSNIEGTVDIKDSYSVPFKAEERSLLAGKNYDYQLILKHFSKIENDSKNLYKRYITSLIAKPFVIITGNSGTGKTRIARIIARWLSGELSSESTFADINYYCLVPVGADWTDNRNITGYYNPIKEVYQATPILDLIINAKDNPDKPFFLILDEMNLSHVERYFSDFLSGMESGEELTLHSESRIVQSTSGKKIPARIKFPTNLFITGTVNIDETTYMFSPKVLDRANVIEFIVSEEDILQSFKVNQSENNDANADDEIKDSFIDLAEKLKEGKTFSLPETDQTNIQNTTLDLFRILKTAEMEFAFRTTNEIIRYANASFQLEEDFNWETCMDEQILQKLLPKLHGSRKKIEKLIVALLEYAHSGELKKSLERIESNTELKFDDNHKFKNSFTKLEKMLKSLKQDGFVSFIQ